MVRVGPGLDLSEQNLSFADLHDLDLSGADLSGADLSESILRDAKLADANLTDANLFRASLVGADVRGADLTGANFPGTNSSSVDFRGAELLGANLSGAQLSGAELSGADLSGAKLAGVHAQDLASCPAVLLGSGWRCVPERGAGYTLLGPGAVLEDSSTPRLSISWAARQSSPRTTTHAVSRSRTGVTCSRGPAAHGSFRGTLAPSIGLGKARAIGGPGPGLQALRPTMRWLNTALVTRKVVLPGGAGLVGQNLIARLLRAGYADIVAIDKHAANLRVLRMVHPQVKAVEADLAERGAWEGEFENATAVVMLQAQIGGTHSEPFVRNNLTASERVIAAMKRHHVRHLVHVSSSVVESVANDDYTRTKAEQERLVLASGIPCIILRPTLMFGWFDRKHLGWLSRFMRKGPVFPVPGHGRYMRQPLYVGDFCNIVLRCLETSPTGEILNISGMERIDYVDMIRQIRDTIGVRTPIVHIPRGLFRFLLDTWAAFDSNPPFTSAQLAALTAGDEFEVIDWPSRFNLRATPFAEAVREAYCDPTYSHVVLDF